MEDAIKKESLLERTTQWLSCWLTCDIIPLPSVSLSDLERDKDKIKCGDVILIEGRSRVSRVISMVTRSPWTHAVLYIGQISDIKDQTLRDHIKKHYQSSPDEPLVVESVMGKGVIFSRLSQFNREHIRICRAKTLSEKDTEHIAEYAIKQAGLPYDKKQILDLAHFFFPWFLIPKRWGSSLFCYKAGEPTKLTCSLLIAEAFRSIRYPILPLIRRHPTVGYEFIRRNTRLFAPKDFDYSPYFEIIKCPIVEFSDTTPYTSIYWNEKLISNDGEEIRAKED